MRSADRNTGFADVFVCNDDTNWHAYYYISPEPTDPSAPWYCLNRTGIEQHVPSLFYVQRNESSPLCHMFCVLSGRGTLHYRGQVSPLEAHQVVLLSSGEPHTYESDPSDPLSLLWLEFCGGDSRRLTRHIIDTRSPVMEGAVFAEVCACITELQQKLMADEWYQPAPDIYQLLWLLMKKSTRRESAEISTDHQKNLRRVEAYIDAHLATESTNAQLAALCGISTQYFTKQFKARYRVTPQTYRMNRRIAKSKYLLTQTDTPVEAIAETLGFCNTSHFVRRFKQREGITPAVYRKRFCLYPTRP